MKAGKTNKSFSPEDRGFRVSGSGQLVIGDSGCTDLANIYGTPLHVVDEKHLANTAAEFLQSFTDGFEGRVSVHYAFKCNPVPGVIEVIRKSGLKAEVMSEFELNLAVKLGYAGREIIVNGPFKPDSFLASCLKHEVRFVIVDSLPEMKRLDCLAGQAGRKAAILLRINPDFVPKGMNSGSATGSRRGCSLGFDLKSGEAVGILDELPGLANLSFNGFHFHIGTGIRHPDDYRKALGSLRELIGQSVKRGLEIKVLDIGGGFAAPGSREMTTREMLLYQAMDRLPRMRVNSSNNQFKDFAEKVSEGIGTIFPSGHLPELITEPGRCITSSSQVLLVRVHSVKEREGLKKWLTTDGGIGTVAMPAFYEYHEVFLCDDVGRPLKEHVNINGPGCFASDMIYRNKLMPEVRAGEVLAIMDSGAYFTSWESNFGFPRPAIVAAADGRHRILRRRETFEEMTERDLII